ncbi:Co-chaperone protein DjlA [subsurface metagenome]
MPEPSFIKTQKTVSQTLADLRNLLEKKWEMEDWEPIPAEKGPGYAVRYYRSKSWTEIGSYYQPTKAMNLRVCYQVIDNMLRWETRGVTGLVKGTAFMGGELVATERGERESFDEACAILGVEPEASWEEIDRVYKIKVQYAHPDRYTKSEEKKVAEERFKRIQKAYDIAKKVKGAK